jgi:RimJ/RimL family protein N-acetyltransferase
MVDRNWGGGVGASKEGGWAVALGPVPMPIETDRLVLRPFKAADAKAIFRVWGDAEVMKYIPRGPYASPFDIKPRLERLARFQEEHGMSLWAVCLREPSEESLWDVPIGSAGLNPVGWQGPEVEVAFHLSRELWGNGLGTEAASAAVAYGFTELGLERIIGLTFPENLASQKVLLKIGMSSLGPTTEYYGLSLLKFEKLREE